MRRACPRARARRQGWRGTFGSVLQSPPRRAEVEHGPTTGLTPGENVGGGFYTKSGENNDFSPRRR